MRIAAVPLLLLCLAAAAWAGLAKKPAFLKVERFKPHHGKTFVPLDVHVQVKFSRPIDPASLSRQTAELMTLAGADVPVTYSQTQKGRVLVLTPVRKLASSTDFKVVVRPGLLSTDGRTLKAERHANFFTVSHLDPNEILRPDQFAELASTMTEGRAAHSAALLADGRVLLAGGMADYTSYAVGADLFDPTTNTFHFAAGQLNDRRAYQPATRFGEASIQIGGLGPNGALASTEVWIGQSGQFVVGPRMHESRDFLAAVALKDGRVLVTGGLDYTAQGAIYSDTAEIYDGDAGGFRFTKSPPLTRRAGHTLTVLPDGRVLIVGGLSGGASTPVTAELFDPATETFTTTAGTPAAHRQLHTATLLDDKTGLVLLVDGGWPLLEAYDPTSDSFYPAGGASSVLRTGATASLLPDGRVLIAGGLEDLDGNANDLLLDSFDLWFPSGGDHGAVVRPQVVFPEPRYGHTATTLADRRILYAGGFGLGTASSLATAVIFTPDPAPSK